MDSEIEQAEQSGAQSVVNLLLSEGVVAYQRGLARAIGCHSAGLLLSQFWYWTERLPTERDGWFYISQDEIYDQTVMTRREQETARKKLRELGLIHEERKGLPAKLWYKVDREAVTRLLLEFAKNALPNKNGVKRHTRKDASAKQESAETPGRNGANVQASSAQSDNPVGAETPVSDGAFRQAITKSISETSAQTSSDISSESTLNIGGKDKNIKEGESALGIGDTDDSTFQAVQAVADRFRDQKSIRRFKQLRLICRDNNRLGIWQEALRSTEKRMRTHEILRPGAYFCAALVRQLEDVGIVVPVGDPAEREEVSNLIDASLGLSKLGLPK